MSLTQLTELFQWMTIINATVFVVSALLMILLKKVVFRLHARLFGIPEREAAVVGYGYLGTYRLLILVFNIVPYVALLIIR